MAYHITVDISAGMNACALLYYDIIWNATLVDIVDAGMSYFWSNFSASGMHGGPVFLRVVTSLQYPSLRTYFENTMRNWICTSRSNQVKKNEIGWPFGTYGW